MKELQNPFDREIKEEVVDFVVDEKARTVTLTEKGTKKAEKLLWY